jgi:putative ABC transport system ATP-binding protein
VVMVTHDPVAAATADRVVFLADGRIAGELDRPTPQSVAAAMTALSRGDDSALAMGDVRHGLELAEACS